MRSAVSAFSGTLSLAGFHYLLRTTMALAVAVPLGHAASSQFDLLQGLTTLARPSVGWTVACFTLAGWLLAPWIHLAISYALAHRRSITAGFAMTSARYLDALRIGFAFLLIKMTVALLMFALGLGVHAILKDTPDPRLHDLSLLAVGFIGMGSMFCLALWHDRARCMLVLQDQPWLLALRTAALQARHRGIYRPYAALSMLGILLLALAAMLLSLGHRELAIVITAQQLLLFGYSLCRIARLKTTLTNVDLNP